jgi:hypothetical protein
MVIGRDVDSRGVYRQLEIYLGQGVEMTPMLIYQVEATEQ